MMTRRLLAIAWPAPVAAVQTTRHRVAVVVTRVPSGLGSTPDGLATTSGGGRQGATNQPIPVKPGEITPLDRTWWDRVTGWFR